MRTESFQTPNPVRLDIRLGAGEVRLEASKTTETTVRLEPLRDNDASVAAVEEARVEQRGDEILIDVRERRRGFRGSEVLVEVADTGGGIPDHVLPSVCEPFFTTREEGTGLGLAIAKRYVEQNGGRLEIRSTPGAGTTVRVRLPTGAAA